MPTDHSRKFYGADLHSFELYVALTDIQDREIWVRPPHTHGFVERLHRTLLKEYLRASRREPV